jgi:hypothetical protein
VHPFILEHYLTGSGFTQDVQEAEYNDTELNPAEQYMLCLLKQRVSAPP